MTVEATGAVAAPGPQAALLADVQRRLSLFAEAISGRSALLAPIEQLDQSFRADVFTCDGKHYWLPAWIDTFPSRAANVAHYRLALVHQMGYQRYGTFRFSRQRFRQRYPELDATSTQLPSKPSHKPWPRSLELEDWFHGCEQPLVLQTLFATIEAARIDLRNYRQFPGLRRDLIRAVHAALADRPPLASLNDAEATLEALTRLTLRLPEAPGQPDPSPATTWLAHSLQPVEQVGATVETSAAAALTIYRVMQRKDQLGAARIALGHLNLIPADTSASTDTSARSPLLPVGYRGQPFAVPALASRRHLQAQAVAGASAAGPNAGQQHPEPGDKPDPMTPPDPETIMAEHGANDTSHTGRFHERQVLIDEWDYRQQQMLRGWCTLKEYRLTGSAGTFRQDLLNRYRDTYSQIKRQFNALRPDAIRLQRGLPDGETFELDRMIERYADRRAGRSGDEHLYQRRERAERDVAAAFLLDISASTDFKVPDPLAGPQPEAPAPSDLDDIGWSPYDALSLVSPTAMVKSRRVIDIARESLGLMAAGLHDIGDRFALYAYSGQGRHEVNFGVAKEFDESCSNQTWGALSALEPQGSSRMGAPIRHAGARLARVLARMKILIIITDGYPQDIDYGPDRRSDEYGIQDTAHAIQELSQAGVQVFCLSVDPAGNDYLRRVCAPNRYLVIDEVNALPVELVKVYQGLTASAR